MRPITSSAKFFLVQKLNVSNKAAIALIAAGEMLINGKHATYDQKITVEDLVICEGVTLQTPSPYVYYIYHKPVGIECTLNPSIEGNLKQYFTDLPHVYPVGRLDKASEGLLLLTNDGKLCDKITHSDQHQEKEYWVEVDKPFDDHFIEKMEQGVDIMGKRTKPARLTKMDDCAFTIILTQGLNRQIRRMCYKLGYQVIVLRRIRIINVLLGDLPYGQYRQLTSTEIQELKKIVN